MSVAKLGEVEFYTVLGVSKKSLCKYDARELIRSWNVEQIYNLCIHQLDMDSAFLYAPLDEDVFMKSPPDMDIETKRWLRLSVCMDWSKHQETDIYTSWSSSKVLDLYKAY